MEAWLICSLSVAVLGGLIFLFGTRDIKLDLKKGIKQTAIPAIVVAIFLFGFMSCLTKGCEPTHDNSEFNWDGSPKNPLQHTPFYE